VTIFDNLSRPGTPLNLAWLQQQHPSQHLRFVCGDICDYSELQKAMTGTDVVYHLAAQTAVTRSIINPRDDFGANALGTFNVLEAARHLPTPPIVVYASTNKVYGALPEARIQEEATRYILVDHPQGITEQWPLNFHSPYGCSKGAADQYVRDYARMYGLRTIVIRQSCIYGQRQFGIEDQGWVAWFVIASALGQPITVYGNGKQVRDLLHVRDLARAWNTAVDRIHVTAGQIYNLGGGVVNAISIWAEFGGMLNEVLGRKIQLSRFEQWRPGDQPVFICDTSKAKQDFNWEPEISVRSGVADLADWVQCYKNEIVATLSGC
jgi:CDP-paratose 2-epimerase